VSVFFTSLCSYKEGPWTEVVTEVIVSVLRVRFLQAWSPEFKAQSPSKKKDLELWGTSDKVIYVLLLKKNLLMFWVFFQKLKLISLIIAIKDKMGSFMWLHVISRIYCEVSNKCKIVRIFLWFTIAQNFNFIFKCEILIIFSW
jgi:hypothetical protein